eukprot:768565-Hanusia_phi.AAC.2
MYQPGSHFQAWVLSQQSVSPVRRYFGIHQGVGGRGGSRLVHPLSPFSKNLAFVSGVALVYCCITTPVQLSFLWNRPVCPKPVELPVDMAAEAIFLIELVLAFFTATYRFDGDYVDELKTVASTYFRGSFFFDAVTTAPISWIEFFVLFDICKQRTSLSYSDFGYIFARAPLRLLRPLRLIKVFRLLRLIRMMSSISKYNSSFSLWMRKALYLLVTLVVLAHICLCAFWLVKELSNESLEEFVLSYGLQDGDLWGKYILSAYFVNTVFTTVGFGDVTGTNTAERIFCIFLLWIGTTCFAIFVSEMQETITKMNARGNSRKERLEGVKITLQSCNCEKQLTEEVLSWVNLSHTIDEDQQETLKVSDGMVMFGMMAVMVISIMVKEKLMKSLPDDLKEKLAQCIDRGVLANMSVFSTVSNPFLPSFLCALILEADYMLLRLNEACATCWMNAGCCDGDV